MKLHETEAPEKGLRETFSFWTTSSSKLLWGGVSVRRVFSVPGAATFAKKMWRCETGGLAVAESGREMLPSNSLGEASVLQGGDGAGLDPNCS